MRIVSLLTLACGVAAQFSCQTGQKAKSGDPSCWGSTSATCSPFTCCDADPNSYAKCSSHTCTAGYKVASAKTSETCAFGICADLQCCELDPSLCLSQAVASGILCNVLTPNFMDLKKMGNEHKDDLATNCCSPYTEAQCQDWSTVTTCASGTYADPSKKSNVAGDIKLTQQADYRSKCCTSVATCQGFSGCSEGSELSSSPATRKCSSDAASCTETECCSVKAGTCRAHPTTCALGKAKGNLGSEAGDTPSATCCVDLLKCSQYSEEVDAASEAKVSIFVGVSLTAALATVLM